MIRVAFVQAWLTIGGAERLVQALAERMDRSRVQVSLIHLYGLGTIGEQMQQAGWPFVTNLASWRFDPFAGGRLARALAESKADVVYAFDSALTLFWMGMQRRFHPKPRIVLGFHSTGKLGDPVQHLLARSAALPVLDTFVALSDSHRTFLSRELQIPETRFEVIGSGVDLARFHIGRSRLEARRAAGLPEAGPLVGIIAALRPEKNHALFLAAAARVAAEVPEARFVIAGDGPARADVEQLVRASGLGDRLLVLGARQDVPQLYRALDVAVLSSHPIVETLPVTLIEAAASGTPAVATTVGSVADVVADGETGYLVPVGDAAALAARITTLLRDTALRERMGAAARARAERRFDERDMIRRYEDLFVRVAGS
jgi:glycosyltransferase involved in cell wall biosynthesis